MHTASTFPLKDLFLEGLQHSFSRCQAQSISGVPDPKLGTGNVKMDGTCSSYCSMSEEPQSLHKAIVACGLLFLF